MAVPLTLDSILPKITGKTILLLGDLSSKRDQLLNQFILNGLHSEGTSTITTLISSANDFIDNLKAYSDNAAMLVDDAILNERLRIIDMYSFRGISEQEVIPGVHSIGSADDLTLLSITINQISKQFPKNRFVIWPFSLLTIYSSQKDMVNFVQTLSARMADRKQCTVMLADTGVLDDKMKAIVESLVDCVIETRREDEHGNANEALRIKFFRGEETTQFDNWTAIL